MSAFRPRLIFARSSSGLFQSFLVQLFHEDTDFGGVQWKEAESGYNSSSSPQKPEDAIRAWERLELLMSRLEKPYDRHEFYRRKMRARRKAALGHAITDKLLGWFLRGLNRVFEATSDYGWGVGRAPIWWLANILLWAVVLFFSVDCKARDSAVGFASAADGSRIVSVANSASRLELFGAAVATSFANTHSILGLASDDGYLDVYRELLQQSVNPLLFNVIGTIEAVLGPIFLFLILLTLRNRFRLA